MRLFIAILLSVLALSTWDIFPDQDHNSDWDLLKIGGPGVFYSIYLISCIPRNLTLVKALGIFLLLVSLWFFAFWVGLKTYGVGAIFVGAVNASIIDEIIFYGKKIPLSGIPKYLLSGGLSALLGYLLFFAILALSKDTFDLPFGSTMIGIVLCWQLGMGLLIEKQKRSLPRLELDKSIG